jgi:hypothetical protein
MPTLSLVLSLAQDHGIGDFLLELGRKPFALPLLLFSLLLQIRLALQFRITACAQSGHAPHLAAQCLASVNL